MWLSCLDISYRKIMLYHIFLSDFGLIEVNHNFFLICIALLILKVKVKVSPIIIIIIIFILSRIAYQQNCSAVILRVLPRKVKQIKGKR